MAKRLAIGVGGLGLLFVTGWIGLRAYRGPTGEIGESWSAVPEFPSLDPAR